MIEMPFGGRFRDKYASRSPKRILLIFLCPNSVSSRFVITKKQKFPPPFYPVWMEKGKSSGYVSLMNVKLYWDPHSQKCENGIDEDDDNDLPAALESRQEK